MLVRKNNIHTHTQMPEYDEMLESYKTIIIDKSLGAVGRLLSHEESRRRK